MNEIGNPVFSYVGDGDKRLVMINFKSSHSQGVKVTFKDPERPDETNAQETERLKQIAKPILQAAIDSL